MSPEPHIGAFLWEVEEVKEKTPVKLKEVKMTITKPLEVSWLCPGCGALNTEYFYNAPGRTRLQCDYCGEEYIGVR